MNQPADRRWWREAVVYQVYPRSFQDSDGDGVGDLRGVTERLDHLAWLGVDALWLSPIHPSPLADGGYDVSDYDSIDPRLGSLEDFEALVEGARSRGIRIVIDLVASHTSIEHPWFRQHPDRYVWAEGGPPNNWLAAFGGPAWSRDRRSGRWYLHSFYPEQPDLDWRNPEVGEAIGEVIALWRGRGVDGFRLDAADRLLKDAELRDNPAATKPFALPLHPEPAGFDQVHSLNAPDIGLALEALKRAAGEAPLVGEVYLPNEALASYLDHLDLVFSFEFLHAPWEPAALRAAVAGAAALDRVAWVLSNHDFPRLATRLGEGRARAAALLLLTLPAPRSSTRETRSGWPTAPAPIRRSTAPAATPTATRCSGSRGRMAASAPGIRGCPWSIPRRAASPPSAATPTRCCGSIGG